jgi:hypothetical protein
MSNENEADRNPIGQPIQRDLVEPSQQALVERLTGGKRKKYARFVMAVLGSIPWVGGLIAAASSLSAEQDQQRISDLQRIWLEEHKVKVEELGQTLNDIFARLDNFGEEVQERVESPEYLALVRKTFRSWDEADTEEKRQMLKKLITNAGAKNLCPDDLIRLFISWINQYHEAHFAVIKQIYKTPGVTRGEIWDSINPKRPPDNSSDADLFRYLIRELSTGGVIRQERETDMDGRFLKRDTRGQSHANPSRVMESAFENTKPYVLTELGKQFVHYVMEDVVPAIGGDGPAKPRSADI